MENLKNQIDMLMDEAIEIRRQLHQNPEISNKEFETSALIKKILTENGIEIEDLGLETGVSAIIRGGKSGRTIGLRADIDALPMEEKSGLPFASKNLGVCHSCGHDINTAYLLLVGKVLQDCREELAGNVRLLFQPAEEIGKGAKDMIAKGVLTKEPAVDEIVGIHVDTMLPTGHVGLKKGSVNAGADIIDITVRGVGGHGARPAETVDPIVSAAYLITQLQTLISREISPLRPAVLSFGKIIGGTKSNIIPDTVVISGTLRTFDHETRAKIIEGIKRICKLQSESMRTTAEVVFDGAIAPLINDPDVIDKLEIAATETIGKERVIILDEPYPASDDFSEFLAKIPGVRYLIGNRTSDPRTGLTLHSSNLIFDEENIIKTAALVTCQYVCNELK